MLAATLSFPSPISAYCKTYQSLDLSLRASIVNYPLASRIFVRRVELGTKWLTGRNLFVLDLPYSTKESCLQKEFANFGQIAKVKLVKDDFTKRSKGYAFIQYTSQDDAMLAVENMDQQVFGGRLIYVEIAKPGKDRFRRYPKTSGPPTDKQHLQETNDVADCWY
ncbi:organelle RRM domain-containing protein 1, chloroplastic isoform X1 [Herrania umbratica]|uniref:Organelle RRM domain-containing protein 1, chloroplastic isoform X1 n=1 Tax=Herrania umbratica TaxID=108875 RepID=A0A6J1BM96_9ROSI|nr:organelle RRM domain-containing protein 1, chloroplastic isoform X1 [Herrania umbratica]